MANCQAIGCGLTAERIMDGGTYCAGHGPGDRTSEVPVAYCATGCGLPAARQIAGWDFCRDHDPRHLPPAPDAPRAA